MPTTDPPDIDLQIYSKIRAILEEYQPWAALVDPKNRIWLDEDESNFNPDKSNKSDGDYPEALLEQNAGASTMMFGDDQTFGTMSGLCKYKEDQSHTFRLTETIVGTQYKEASNLRRLTTNALRLAGPRLGLDFVVKWAFRWTLTRQVDAGETDRTVRSKIVIDIVVESQSDGSHLTGED